MLRAQKLIIRDEIIDLLKLGKPTSEIFTLIGTKFHLAKRTFFNHFRGAQLEFNNIHSKKKEALENAEKEVAVIARKKKILTALERKEYLSKIIVGEIKIQKSELRWNPKTEKFRIVKLIELPSHTARISAISELNKMGGDYAPTKIATTDTDGNDVERAPMTDEQVKFYLEQRRKQMENKKGV